MGSNTIDASRSLAGLSSALSRDRAPAIRLMAGASCLREGYEARPLRRSSRLRISDSVGLASPCAIALSSAAPAP
jgi:hypothetical protein